MDEIPVAKREINPDKKKSGIPNATILIFFSGLVVLVAGWLFWNNTNNEQLATSNSTTANVESENPDNVDNSANNPDNSSTSTQPGENIPENILGHLRYEQAPPEDLKSVTSDGSIRLRTKAADKFLQMQGDARRQGISLVPLSGFRTISQQEYLFFQIKEQRSQDTSKRAEVSAPPGHSEHHTGYAIDIGDANSPATNLSESFERTAAFQWLVKNAPKYSFELSFPRDNPQGISYEPWHWRYVGDTHSLETFYKARQLETNLR